MSKKKKSLFFITCIFALAIIGGVVFVFMPRDTANKQREESVDAQQSPADITASNVNEFGQKTQDPVDAISALASDLLSEIEAEKTLNVSMTAQLRTYHDLLQLISDYAESVEKDIDLIREISKNEFQEDVSLQASLFTGKKSVLVAKHLEEFHPTRVGAILAKMKENEASQVLDVWAKEKTPESRIFYRHVVDTYLLNKRRDMNSELFDRLVISETERAAQ